MKSSKVFSGSISREHFVLTLGKAGPVGTAGAQAIGSSSLKSEIMGLSDFGVTGSSLLSGKPLGESDSFVNSNGCPTLLGSASEAKPV